MKIFRILFLCIVMFFSISPLAFAHAVVTPSQAGVGEFVNFSLGVPSEKPMATTAVRLLMPQGLNEITPFVKPGWTVSVKKDADSVTEIDWSGGNIPAEEKDQFLFSAQVPPQAATLQWKAYQIYQDGSVVSWDQNPQTTADNDMSSVGPYSQTTIVNDLASVPKQFDKVNLALGLAALALLVSLGALLRGHR